MKKISVFLITWICITLLSGCIDIYEPIHEDTAEITTSYGDVFSMARIEYNVPDQEISIGISHKDSGDSVFSYAGFSNYLNDYDYENDLLNKWYEIIGEYNQDGLKAYQFYWGIIYTTDGDNYKGILKHEYETSEDKFFPKLKEVLEI